MKHKYHQSTPIYQVYMFINIFTQSKLITNIYIYIHIHIYISSHTNPNAAHHKRPQRGSILKIASRKSMGS